MKKIFILDGNDFDDLEGFYREIDRLLTRNLTWQTGHNLDALLDLLRGGFGVHEYGEPILIKWKHFDKSKADLGAQATLNILEIMCLNKRYGHRCRVELHPRD